jgi:hypothetical protein
MAVVAAGLSASILPCAGGGKLALAFREIRQVPNGAVADFKACCHWCVSGFYLARAVNLGKGRLDYCGLSSRPAATGHHFVQMKLLKG